MAFCQGFPSACRHRVSNGTRGCSINPKGSTEVSITIRRPHKKVWGSRVGTAVTPRLECFDLTRGGLPPGGSSYHQDFRGHCGKGSTLVSSSRAPSTGPGDLAFRNSLSLEYFSYHPEHELLETVFGSLRSCHCLEGVEIRVPGSQTMPLVTYKSLLRRSRCG